MFIAKYPAIKQSLIDFSSAGNLQMNKKRISLTFHCLCTHLHLYVCPLVLSVQKKNRGSAPVFVGCDCSMTQTRVKFCDSADDSVRLS